MASDTTTAMSAAAAPASRGGGDGFSSARSDSSDEDDVTFADAPQPPKPPPNPILSKIPALRVEGLPPPGTTPIAIPDQGTGGADGAGAGAATRPAFKLDMARVAAARAPVEGDRPDDNVPYTPLGRLVEDLKAQQGGTQAGQQGTREGASAAAPELGLQRRESLKLDLARVPGPTNRALEARHSLLNEDSEEMPPWVVDAREVALGKRIGSGAFGEVFEAAWRRHKIAVKRSVCATLDARTVRLLKAEMEIMARLRHRHIVHFLGACVEADQMMILFEHCRFSMLSLLQDDRVPLSRQAVVDYCLQVALGMYYLHQCRPPVLHLDLKAANVLVDRHGVAKVCDFGLSHVKREAAIVTSRMGSAQWTAPEVLRGEPHDETADVYSFAFFMLEMCTRELPYPSMDSYQVVMGVITGLLARPTPPESDLAPATFIALMERCWRDSRHDRPRFDTVLDVLEGLANQIGAPPEGDVLAALSLHSGQRAPARPLPPVPPQTRQPASDGSDEDAPSEGDQGDASARSDFAPNAYCVANFDYAAKRADELSFQRGARIRALGPSETPGWWRGRVAGRSGLFPENYVAFEVGGSSSQHVRSSRLSDYDDHAGTRASSRSGDAKAGSRRGTGSPRGQGGGGANPALTDEMPLERKPLEEVVELGEQRLGHGKASVVLRARDRRSLELVAVKVVDTREDGHSTAAERRSRALNEARMLHVLAGARGEAGASCTVQLRCVVQSPGEENVAIITELLTGGDLFDRIESGGPLDEAIAQRVCAQLLHALAQLHSRHIVHGDLKPNSVMFASQASDAPVRLIDFSEARQQPLGADGRILPLTGLCGTADYAAPEVLSWLLAPEGAGAGAPLMSPRGPDPAAVAGQRGLSERVPYDAAVDCWSLGVLAYIMLSGFPPFYGEDEAEMLGRIVRGDYEFPSSLEAPARGASDVARATAWARVSPLARDFIQRLLVVDPAQRMDAAGGLQHPWVTHKYDSGAVQASLGALRDRSVTGQWDGMQRAAAGATSLRHSRAGSSGGDVCAATAAPSATASSSAGVRAIQHRSAPVPTPARAQGTEAVDAPARSGMGWSLGQLGLTNTFSRWFVSRVVGERQIRLVVVGLDGAGKTSLLHRLKLGTVETAPVPTVGVNVERVAYRDFQLDVCDLGGQEHVRRQWTQFLSDESAPAHGVVFVVDSTDVARMHLAHAELTKLAANEHLRSTGFVVFANKQVGGSVHAAPVRRICRDGPVDIPLASSSRICM